MNRAIIAAAGWKGGGRDIGYAHVPIPFIPLEDGSTVVGRLSATLKQRGFSPIIAVGAIGYPFSAYQPRGDFFTEKLSADAVLDKIGVHPGGSPWTGEIHEYAARHGELVIVPDPGWTNPHDTYCRVLDEIGNYERVLLIQGDTLLTTRLWDCIFQWRPSFQFAPCPNHSVFMLDNDGVTVYRKSAEPHRQRATIPERWDCEADTQPDGQAGSGLLQHKGIKLYGWHHTPWRLMDTDALWLDIDRSRDYHMANERIKKGLL